MFLSSLLNKDLLITIFKILEMRRFSERDCANFMKKILHALKYLHGKNIVHRDIKCANIVFDNPDLKNSTLKLIDFGQSELITDYQEKDNCIIGSVYYLCPETTRERNKFELFAGDIWALGIVCYMLVNGVIPFYGNDIESVLKSIQKENLKWQNGIKLSKSCKQFISSLLNKDPSKRLTAEEALNHEWITDQANDIDLGDEYFNKLSALHFQNKLQHILVNAILSKMTESDKKTLLSQINALKKSGNGYVDENQIITSILSSASDKKWSYKNVSNKPFQHNPNMTEQSLAALDIETILQEIDNEEKENVETLKLEIRVTSIDPETDCESESELDKSEFDQTLVKTTPSIHDNISVEKFKEILGSTNKKYDIQEIVNELTPNGSDEDWISFEAISSYHKPIISMTY